MKTIVTVLMMTLGLAVFTGCQSGKMMQPRRYFAIDCQRPGGEPALATGSILRINPFAAAPAYDHNRMTVRRDAVRYETDFYNLYLNEPAIQVASLTRQWLADSGLYAAVAGPRSVLPAELELSATLERLEADLTDPTHPTAAVSLRVLITRRQDKMVQVEMNRLYSAAQPLASRSAEQVVAGFGQALAAILTELETDLRAMP